MWQRLGFVAQNAHRNIAVDEPGPNEFVSWYVFVGFVGDIDGTWPYNGAGRTDRPKMNEVAAPLKATR